MLLLTSADEIPAEAVSEVMEHAVTMLLYSSRGDGSDLATGYFLAGTIIEAP